MLTRREVEARKCYVNDIWERAREVLEVDRDTVLFNTYDLKTGKLCGRPHRQCTKNEIIHWANREATPDESSRLRHDEVDDLFQAKAAAPGQADPHAESSAARLEEEARRRSFMN